MTDVGKLEKIPLRKVWPDEARNFTPWLAENIEALGQALDLSLKVVQREKTVGTFSLDILAEDQNGEFVIIENQIEKTDHDHLGKAVTYLTNLGAKTAVWLTSDPRPEHIRAMAWLNEASPPDIAFYLVKVEAYRIGDSFPAPVFTKIVEPSVEAKEVGQQKEELAQRHVDRLDFWTGLLTKAKVRSQLHANVSPRKDNWVGTSGGLPGVAFNFVILMDDSRVEMYIDRGAGWRNWNKGLFDLLFEQRAAIEEDYGGSISWERLDEGRACRIAGYLRTGGLRDRANWADIQDQLVDAMLRLHSSLESRTQEAMIKAQLAGQDPLDVGAGQ